MRGHREDVCHGWNQEVMEATGTTTEEEARKIRGSLDADAAVMVRRPQQQSSRSRGSRGACSGQERSQTSGQQARVGLYVGVGPRLLSV